MSILLSIAKIASGHKRRFGWSVRTKLLAIVIAVECVAFTLLLGLVAHVLDRSLESAFNAQLATLKPALNAALSWPMSEYDIDGLRDVVEISRGARGLTYMVVRDERDRVILVSGRAPNGPMPSPSQRVKGVGEYHAVMRVEHQDRTQGTLNFGVSTEVIQAERARLYEQGVLIALACVLLTGLLIAVPVYVGTQRLAALASASEKMAQGEFNVPISQAGDDELSRLAAAFVDMRKAIRRRIEAQEKSERKVLRLNSELERRVDQRTEELERACKELESFSYTVSHDLRAPLRAIIGFSNILSLEHSGDLSPAARRDLERIEESAQRMSALIDSLLDFSRYSRAPVNRMRFDPRAIIEEVARGMPAADVARVQLVVGRLPLTCSADPVLLRRVFEILISNALKFSRDASAPVITIAATVSPNGRGVYYVRDNGCGFDMAYSSRLFEVFQRLCGGEYEGVGVGLAIARRIVERHGGSIWARSAPGQGATFYFSLSERAPAALRDNGTLAS